MSGPGAALFRQSWRCCGEAGDPAAASEEAGARAGVGTGEGEGEGAGAGAGVGAGAWSLLGHPLILKWKH